MHTRDFIIVSGQVTKDAYAGNIERETGWTIEAVRRILALEEAALPDIITMTIFLEDAPNFGRYNQIIVYRYKNRSWLRSSNAPNAWWLCVRRWRAENLLSLKNKTQYHAATTDNVSELGTTRGR